MSFFETDDRGFPCCHICKKSFPSELPIISIVENRTAKDISFISSRINSVEIEKPVKVKLFHKECFYTAAGADWWERDLTNE